MLASPRTRSDATTMIFPNCQTTHAADPWGRRFPKEAPPKQGAIRRSDPPRTPSGHTLQLTWSTRTRKKPPSRNDPWGLFSQVFRFFPQRGGVCLTEREGRVKNLFVILDFASFGSASPPDLCRTREVAALGPAFPSPFPAFVAEAGEVH